MEKKEENKKKKYLCIYFKILKRGAISLASSALSTLSVYEGLSALIDDKNFFLFRIPLYEKIAFMVLISIIVACLSIIYLLLKLTFNYKNDLEESIQKNKEFVEIIDDYEDDCNNNQLKPADSIYGLLNDAYNKGRYQEVIKIGMQLSGPLWYTGKYELIAKMGEIIESAACCIGDKSTQAKVLIEVIGWTNVRIGNADLAVQNIERGLQIAKTSNDFFGIASAYRNLGDIHLGKASSNHNLRYTNNPITISPEAQKKEFELTKNYLDLSYTNAHMLLDNNQKTELIGNIEYTYAKYYFEMRDYDEALCKVDSAMDAYININNKDKQIKLYNLKGEILLRIPSRELEAINVFQEGLKNAVERCVNVHIVSNALCLAEYFHKSNQIAQTRRMINIANDYISAITDPLLICKLETLEKKLELQD